MDVGFIGAGNIARSHLDNLDGIDAADVVAICDVDEERAREAAEPRDASVYTDHAALYEGEDLDAVYVCIPPFAHEDQELMAAERGIDLFVEKPVAREIEKAREVRAAVEDAGILTQVGYVRRYADLVQRARDLIGDRELALIEAQRYGGVPGTAWWRQFELSGGQVVEMSTHEYDTVRYLGGEVEAVTAYGGRKVRREEIDFEDTTVAAMHHTDGTVSHVTSSSAAPSGHRTFDVVGEDCRLHIDWSDGTLSGTVDGEAVHAEGEGSAMLAEDRAFVRAVEEGDQRHARSPYADAVKTFALTLAVNESLSTGEPVEPAE